MKSYLKLISVIILFPFFCYSQSQEPIDFENLIHFSSDNAPINKYFVDITEDVNGNIWVITFDQSSLIKKTYNLSKFDGENWTRYTKEDGLASDKFFTIEGDSKGNVWVATSKGFCVYDGNGWKLTPYNKKFFISNTKIIFEGKNGKIWACSEDNNENFGQVALYDGTKWTLQKTKGLDKYWGVKTIFEDSQNRVWIGVGQSSYKKRGRVRYYKDNNWKIYKPKITEVDPTMPNKCVQTIVEDNDGNIWIGEGYGKPALLASNGGGIKMYDGQTWKVFTEEDGLISESVNKIFEDSDGNIWCITTAWEIMKYDGNRWINYSKKDGLIPKIISTIFEDSNGTIWLGGEKGIMRFTEKSFEIVSKLGAYKITEDSNGNLWFKYHSLSSYDGEKFKTYTKKGGYLPSDLNIDYYYDKKQNIMWVMTSKGLSSYNGEAWQIHTEESGAPTRKINSVIVDDNGILWAGTKNGVYSFDGSSWTKYSVENGLVSDNVQLISKDFNNNIWATTGKASKGIGIPIPDLISIGANVLSKSGLNVFSNGKWQAFADDPGVPDSRVIKMFAASNGDMWFNTYKIGFSKYDGSSWIEFNRSNGFRTNHFFSAFEDSKGNIWFILGDGLKGRGVGKFDGMEWTFYDKDSGIPSNSFITIIEDSKGNIWFGTTKGVLKYTP